MKRVLSFTVDDKSMLRYIRDKTAAPYFSNLVWFIGNHVLELDSCVRHDIDHNSRDRLADLVAEHLDHLHYLNDILCLHIDALNEVLTDHLLNRLLIPLYVYSLTKRSKYAPRSDKRPFVNCVVSLFLLSQVFLIMHHAPLVRQLADIIFHGDKSVCRVDDEGEDSPVPGCKSIRGFLKPTESLAKTLDSARGGGKPMKRPNYKDDEEEEDASSSSSSPKGKPKKKQAEGAEGGESTSEEATLEDVSKSEDTISSKEAGSPLSADEQLPDLASPTQNSTDDEKLLCVNSVDGRPSEFTLENKPYLEAVFKALECRDNDYETLFALCLLYAVGHNTGINQELLDSVLMPSDKSAAKDHYNVALVETLINIISHSCQNGSKVRLATLELTIKLLKSLVLGPGRCFLADGHLAAVEGAREEATLLLRNFYKVWEKSEEIFLDMFEDEFREMKSRPLNVEYLTMDASILLPPTGTPLTGIAFNKRLPCGEVERARRAIRVFFSLRDLSLTLRAETETQLPLTKQDECVKLGDVLDLNNSDLIACTVITKDNKRERRFLVIDVLQLILVEPDTRRLGWGKVRFVGFLQDVEVTGDKEDSRSLHITIHKPSMNAHAKPLPLLSARFLFDDHIRCMAAKQRLTKGRLKARQRKMQMIARLLELPAHIVDSMYQPPVAGLSAVTLRAGRSGASTSRGSASTTHPGRAQSELIQRSVFASVDQTQAFEGARDAEAAARDARHLPSRSSRKSPGAVSKSGTSLSAQQQARLKKKAEKAAKARREQKQAKEEVEEAEEAQPSPEAHAFKSLNQSGKKEEGRHSRNPSNGSTSAVKESIEIPLEDLSKKSSQRLLQADARTRSSSYSPKRVPRRRSSADIASLASTSSKASSRGSSPKTATSSGSERSARADSRAGLARERAGSCPSPRHSATSATSDVTSFMKKKRPSAPSPSNSKADAASESPSPLAQPPLRLNSKSRASAEEAGVSADPARVARAPADSGAASEQLSKLVKGASSEQTEAAEGADGVEMKARQKAEENKEDEPEECTSQGQEEEGKTT